MEEDGVPIVNSHAGWLDPLCPGMVWLRIPIAWGAERRQKMSPAVMSCLCTFLGPSGWLLCEGGC